jgi:hypothetical protein
MFNVHNKKYSIDLNQAAQLDGSISANGLESSSVEYFSKEAEERKQVARTKTQAVLNDTTEAQEQLNETLKKFETQFNNLPTDKQQRLNGSWNDVQNALTANNNAKLQLAMAMQGGGELFGVDEAGNVLFKDVGSIPVMYGTDADGKQVMVYNLDEVQLQTIEQYANAHEVRAAVTAAGYELFDNNETGWQNEITLSDDIQQAVDSNDHQHFVHKDNDTWYATWLKSDKTGNARYANFGPHLGRVDFRTNHPGYRGGDLGALRLLRVKV